jgi:hypothetical protein
MGNSTRKSLVLTLLLLAGLCSTLLACIPPLPSDMASQARVDVVEELPGGG